MFKKNYFKGEMANIFVFHAFSMNMNSLLIVFVYNTDFILTSQVHSYCTVFQTTISLNREITSLERVGNKCRFSANSYLY